MLAGVLAGPILGFGQTERPPVVVTVGATINASTIATAGAVVDSGGFYYAADYQRIYRVATESGAWSVILAGAQTPLTNPGALTLTPTGLFLYATSDGQIHRLSSSGSSALFSGPLIGGYADGPLNIARFGQVSAMAGDAAGNIFVADRGNFLIRKISADGWVSTVAGLRGVPGSADGHGTTARFDQMGSLLVEPSGDLVMLDGRRICRITPTGVVTTIAGGNAYAVTDGVGSAAAFQSPQHLVRGPDGNYYVSDVRSIRRITPAGVVTTVVGDPTDFTSGRVDGAGTAARVGDIRSMALAPDGTIYFLDNTTLRKLVVDGVPLAPVIEQSPANAVAQAGGSVTLSVVAHATPAPTYVWKKDGAVLFGQNQPTLSLTNLTANASGTYTVTVTNAHGSATSSPAILEVVTVAANDAFAGRIALNTSPVAVEGQFLGATRETSEPAHNGTASGGSLWWSWTAPSAGFVTVDVVGSSVPAVVRAYTGTAVGALTAVPAVVAYAATNTAARTTFAVTAGTTYQIAVERSAGNSAGTARLALNYSYHVTTFAGAPGESGTTNGTGTAARFTGPRGIARDASGNLYVAENGTIRKITPAGVVTTHATGTPSSSSHLGIDAAGNLYVSDWTNHVIRKITPAGAVSVFAGTAGQNGSTDGTGAGARFYYPAGVAVDASGNVYVADYYNAAIRKITPAGVVTTLAGSANSSDYVDAVGTEARFVAPQYLALSGSTLFVIDGSGTSTRLRAIALGTATVTTLASDTDALSNGITSLGSDPVGNAYIGMLGEVRRVTPTGGVTRILGGTPSNNTNYLSGDGLHATFRYVWGLIGDSTGNLWFTSDNTVHRAAPSSLALAPIVFAAPTSATVAIGANVNLAVTAFGGPTVSYQWNKGGVPLSGRTGPTLALSSVTVGDSGSYTVTVSNPSGTVTSAAAVLTVQAPPANDAFASATLLSGANASGTGNNYGAGRDAGEPVITAAAAGRTVWWNWVAPADGTLAVDAGGSTIKVALAAFSGANVGALQLLAQDDNLTGNDTARFYLSVVAGTTYHFALDGLTGVAALEGTLRLNLTYAYTVVTIGGEVGRASYRDGPLANALFYFPRAIVRDAAGNFYVADYSGNIIRKIAANGTVSLLAGVFGEQGATDGTGAAARFNGIYGLTIDPSGNLYAVERQNHTLRKITPAGVVTTLAGSAGNGTFADGTGAAARFYLPEGIVYAPDGFLYVADYWNRRVRKVHPTTGVVTTLAGSGSPGYVDGVGAAASFNSARSIAVGEGGQLFVTDDNRTIRRIDRSTGAVTTVAGSVSNYGLIDGVGTAAGFLSPTQLAGDGAGNLYIVDAGRAIRRLTAAGHVATIAGSADTTISHQDGIGPDARFRSPGALWVDSSGVIHLVDDQNHIVRRAAPSSLVQVPLITSVPAARTVPAGTAVDLSFGVLGTPAPTFEWRRNGTLLPNVTTATLSLPSAQLGDSGNYTLTVTNTQGSTTSAAIALNIVGAPANNHFGSATVISSLPAVIEAHNFGATAESGEPDHYEGSGGRSVWWRWTAPSDGTVILNFGGTEFQPLVSVYTGATLGALTPVAEGAANANSGAAPRLTFYVTAGTTYRVAVDGRAGATGVIRLEMLYAYGISDFYAGGGARGIVLDASGNTYFAEWGTHSIRRLNPAGEVTTLAGLPGTNGSADGAAASARFNAPWGIVRAANGTLYVADSGNHTIRRIATDGTVTTLAGLAGTSGAVNGTGSAARFNSPRGLALNTAGTHLMIADYNNGAVRQLELSSGVITTLAGWLGSRSRSDGFGVGARFVGPTDILLAPSGDFYVADVSSNPSGASIRVLSPTGDVRTLAGASASSPQDGIGSNAYFGHNLSGLCFDPQGNLLIADFPFVRRVTPEGVVTTISGNVGFIYDLVVGPDGTGYVTDGVGVRRLAPLTVAPPPTLPTLPTFNQHPQSTTLFVGDTLYLTAGANGTPDVFTFQWFHNGTPLNGATSATLSIIGITAQQAGSYTTVVTNATGERTSNAATVTVNARPANSSFVNAIALSGASPSATANNAGAAREAGEPFHGGNFVGASLWWTWTAPASGAVILDTAGSTTDTIVGVYTGSAVGALTAIASARQPLITQTNQVVRRARVTFTAIEGTTYRIALDGEFGFTGELALHLAYVYNVTTLAGLAGTSGNSNGNGTAARFNQPHAIAVDSAGNAYIADANNHAIRKVTPQGEVTTFAGTAGSSGNADGTGSVARFNYPTGIVIAANGNLYVADTNNHVIRQITPAGVVTTLAGSKGTAGSVNGTGTGARFNYPRTLAIDPSGNLYVTDIQKHWVRKVTPAGAVTTLAGQADTSGTTNGTGTAALFTNPVYLAADSTGNVYVSENGTVRRITPAGVVTTRAGVAGNRSIVDGSPTTARFSGPGALLVRADDSLLVSDGGALRLIASDGYVFTITGDNESNATVDGTGFDVRFNSLSGLTRDSAGRIYAVEYYGNVVRRGLLSSAPAAPSISLQPQSARIIAGSNVTLTSGAIGNPVATYQWRKNGAPITNATSTTLTLTNVQPSDSGNYTLVATNAEGATNSDVAVLEILPLPGNDSFNRRTTILGDANTFTAYNFSATAQSGEPAIAGTPASKTVWFTWTAPASGDVTFDTIGSSFDTRMAVFRGDTLSQLTLVAANASEAGRKFSRVRFAAKAGDVFQIAIDGVNGATGDYRLTLDYSWNFVSYSGAFSVSGTTNGALADARYNFPAAFALDGSGNVFLADTSNHVIRKITPAGVVSTFAGTAGSSGTSNGTGAAARFNRPFGLAIDSSGNLYVADTSNHAIRKITPAGAVTTLAGTAGTSGSADGTGAAARFNLPSGVAVDATGNVFVTDYSNSLIRKITAAGVVTTFAGALNTSGNSPQYFSSPWGIAVDAAGNVYVADPANIKKITPAGVSSLFAGDISGFTGTADGVGAAAQFNNPGQIVVDASGNVFVADKGNQLIRKISPTGEVRTIGGESAFRGRRDGTAEEAGFADPMGIALDAGGFLYVGDSASYLVRLGARQAGPRAPRITTQPVNQSVSAGGTANFVVVAAGLPAPTYQWRKNGTPISGQTGVVLTLNSVSASDVANYDVVITNANGSATSALAAFSLATAPTNDAFANATALSGTSASATAFATSATAENGEPAHAGQTAARSLWWSWTAPGNGAVIAETTGSALDTRLAIYTGASLGTLTLVGENDDALAGGASRVQFNATSGTTYRFAVDVNGAGNGAVRLSVDYALVATTFAGTADSSGATNATGAAARFNNPFGTARDSAGNLYVADSANHTIRKITPAGVVTTFAGSPGVAGSADGTGTAARFNTPTGVAVDLVDRVVVADYGNHTIRRITPEGVVTTVAGTAGAAGFADGTGAAARFNFPIDVTTGPVINGGGTIYVTDYGNHTVRKITTAGVVTTLAGTAGASGFADGTGAAARFDGPRGPATDSSENVYLADFNNHTIRKITPAGVVTTVAGFPGSAGAADGVAETARFWGPADVSVHANSGALFVADMGNRSVRRVSSTGVVSTVAGGVLTTHTDGTAFAAGFATPVGIEFDGNGVGYVADYASHTIRKLTPANLAVSAQTITFDALADRTFTTTLALSATASSGLSVSFAVVSGPATVSGNTLTLTGTGTITVRATQSGNGSYSAATPVERSFSVTANFNSWLVERFDAAQRANAQLTGPNADFDRDGLSNLVEYALGLDPTQTNSSGASDVTIAAGDWTFTYQRPAARSDVTYAVEVSTNLTTWTTVGVAHERTATGTTETWRARYPLASATQAFFRLKVSRP